MKQLLIFLRTLGRSFALARNVRLVRYRAEESGTVVFNTVGCYNFDTFMSELYYAHLLARSGCDVHILLDDFTLDHWEYIQWVNGPGDFLRHRGIKSRMVIGAYTALARWVFRHPRLKFVSYSAMLAAVPAGEVRIEPSDEAHLEDSVLRYAQSGVYDLANAGQRRYYEACVSNALRTKRVSLYVQRYLQPNLYISTHAIFSCWGPAYDSMKAAGVPCLVYCVFAYQWQQVQFSDARFQFLSESSSWRNFASQPLSPERRRHVDEYFSSRFQAKASDTAIYYSNAAPIEGLDISKEGYRATFGMFPNVISDASIRLRNTVFDGPLAWVVETVRWFELHPEYQLILRFHPGEATLFTSAQKVESLLRLAVPHVDQIKNVRLIPSQVKVKSYDLVRAYVDVGLVYEGMIGLELPYLGVPAITASKSRYQGVGNSFEPTTKDEYFAMLSRPLELAEKFKSGPYREKSLHFSYWYLFVSGWRCPVFDPASYGRVNFSAKSSDLDPNQSEPASSALKYLLEARGGK